MHSDAKRNARAAAYIPPDPLLNAEEGAAETGRAVSTFVSIRRRPRVAAAGGRRMITASGRR